MRSRVDGDVIDPSTDTPRRKSAVHSVSKEAGVKRTVFPHIAATRLANPVPGVWCPRCLVPSGVTCSAALELDGRPWQVAEFAWCVECGEQL